MKKFFILFFINLIYLGSNAQSLWDLGRRSFQDVLKMNNVKPCEITENRIYFTVLKTETTLGMSLRITR